MAMTTTGSASYQMKEYYPRRKKMPERTYKQTREATEGARAKRTGRYSGGAEAAAGEREGKETIRELGRGARSMQEGGVPFITRPWRRAAGREAEKEALATRGEEYGVGKRLPWKTPQEKAAERGAAAHAAGKRGAAEAAQEAGQERARGAPRMNPLREQYAGESGKNAYKRYFEGRGAKAVATMAPFIAGGRSTVGGSDKFMSAARSVSTALPAMKKKEYPEFKEMEPIKRGIYKNKKGVYTNQ